MLQSGSEFEILADSERLLLRVTCEWRDPCCRATPAVPSAMKSAVPNLISMALTRFSQRVPGRCGSHGGPKENKTGACSNLPVF